MNNKIYRIQEGTSRIVCNDYKSNFKELVERDYSIAINERNTQYLAIEVYIVKNGFSPIIMTYVSLFCNNFVDELRSVNHLQRTSIQAVHFECESITTLGTKICDHIPERDKASKYLMIFNKRRSRIGLARVALVAFAESMLPKLISEIDIYFFAKSHYLLNLYGRCQNNIL